MGMRLPDGGNSVKAILTRLDKRKAVELQFDPFVHCPSFIFRHLRSRRLRSRMPVLLNLDHRTETWLALDQMRILKDRKRIPNKAYEWAVVQYMEDSL